MAIDISSPPPVQCTCVPLTLPTQNIGSNTEGLKMIREKKKQNLMETFQICIKFRFNRVLIPSAAVQSGQLLLFTQCDGLQCWKSLAVLVRGTLLFIGGS